MDVEVSESDDISIDGPNALAQAVLMHEENIDIDDPIPNVPMAAQVVQMIHAPVDNALFGLFG